MRLGDLVYYFTKYTGIRYLWKKINPDCGCDERREKWNVILNTTISLTKCLALVTVRYGKK